MGSPNRYTHVCKIRQQNAKGIVMLRNVKQMSNRDDAGVTYIDIGRRADKFKRCARLGLWFMHIVSGSCHCSKPWPNIPDADYMVASNEYALVLGEILECNILVP
jgi:hypothetical protein